MDLPSSTVPNLPGSTSSLSRNRLESSQKNSFVNEALEEEDTNDNNSPEQDSRSMNSMEREMTLKDRQDVTCLYYKRMHKKLTIIYRL
jgi:hypothetical protein